MDVNEIIFTEFALAKHTSVKNVFCAQDRTEMHHVNYLEFWGSECILKQPLLDTDTTQILVMGYNILLIVQGIV